MNFTLNHLMSMSPCEFERVREGGEDFRHALSNVVLGHLTIPAGWNVNAEYRGEFGGLFPVQCRFNPTVITMMRSLWCAYAVLGKLPQPGQSFCWPGGVVGYE
ncbi:conjugation system SOS inhibitor PsiB family protein [Acerihabitans sp. TG2]|uniref:conjugation system SOS inhibitor PsiB family protein n=1 Tax=Acerihabitans sp. TG2 TaxID=3096008 RepID=UPI003A59870E